MSSIRIEAGGLRRKIIYYLQNKESQNYNYITIDKSMCKRNYICQCNSVHIYDAILVINNNDNNNNDDINC